MRCLEESKKKEVTTRTNEITFEDLIVQGQIKLLRSFYDQVALKFNCIY